MDRATQPRRRTRLIALAASTTLAAGALALGTATAASAVGPSGGPTLTATCNQFTGVPDGGTWQDNFMGLIGNSSATYTVVVTYTDPSNGEQATVHDDEYWYADPDGTYNHTYPGSRSVPVAHTAYTWQLAEYADGTEYDNILTGSGTVGGTTCVPKPRKPNKPGVYPTLLRVAKKGKFEVSIGGDANTTGSVSVTDSGGQLASGSYAMHSNTTTDIKLVLGKGDFKRLKKIRSEHVKVTVTARNSAGQVKSKTVCTIMAPPKK